MWSLEDYNFVSSLLDHQIYFSSVWRHIISFYICFSTLQYLSICSTSPFPWGNSSNGSKMSLPIYLIPVTEALYCVLPQYSVYVKTQCQWGQWKSEIFRWRPLQKHIMFSWTGSKQEGACLLSLPLNKCRQKGAVHCGGFPPGKAHWLVKTKSTASDQSHYAWRAYWTRACWTAVLCCALFMFSLTDIHCVGVTNESLWGLKVKAVIPREGLKILS